MSQVTQICANYFKGFEEYPQLNKTVPLQDHIRVATKIASYFLVLIPLIMGIALGISMCVDWIMAKCVTLNNVEEGGDPGAIGSTNRAHPIEPQENPYEDKNAIEQIENVFSNNSPQPRPILWAFGSKTYSLYAVKANEPLELQGAHINAGNLLFLHKDFPSELIAELVNLIPELNACYPSKEGDGQGVNYYDAYYRHLLSQTSISSIAKVLPIETQEEPYVDETAMEQIRGVFSGTNLTLEPICFAYGSKIFFLYALRLQHPLELDGALLHQTGNIILPNQCLPQEALILLHNSIPELTSIYPPTYNGNNYYDAYSRHIGPGKFGEAPLPPPVPPRPEASSKLGSHRTPQPPLEPSSSSSPQKLTKAEINKLNTEELVNKIRSIFLNTSLCKTTFTCDLNSKPHQILVIKTVPPVKLKHITIHEQNIIVTERTPPNELKKALTNLKSELGNVTIAPKTTYKELQKLDLPPLRPAGPPPSRGGALGAPSTTFRPATSHS